MTRLPYLVWQDHSLQYAPGTRFHHRVLPSHNYQYTSDQVEILGFNLPFYKGNNSVPVLPCCSISSSLKSGYRATARRQSKAVIRPTGHVPGQEKLSLIAVRRWKDNEINPVAFLSNLSNILPYLSILQFRDTSLQGEHAK